MSTTQRILEDAIAATSATSSTPSTYLSKMISSFPNSTSPFLRLPSAKDLFLLPVRLGQSAGRMLSFEDPMEVAAPGRTGLAAGVAANAAAEEAGGRWSDAFREVFGIHNIRSFGGMLNYMTSRWAFACFSVVSLLDLIL